MSKDNLAGELRAVCVLDPAIDRILTPIDKYAQTREPSLVRALPGQYLRWCVLQPLSVDDYMVVEGMPTPALKLRTAFMYSVQAIENWDGPGISLRPTRRIRSSDGSEHVIWSAEEMALIFARVGAAFIFEIGTVAYERAIQGNFQSGGVSYTLPLSSSEGLGRIARQLAEREALSSGTTPNERSQQSSTMTLQPSSAAACAAPAASGATAPAV